MRRFGAFSITRTMGAELGPYGIRVNAIAPGMIRTPFTAYMFKDPDKTKCIRFPDRSSIRRVILTALARQATWRHKVGRHELDGRAVLLEYAGPVMCAGARFHPDKGN